MMTHEEKVKLFKIACKMQNLGINERLADQIIVTYEAVLKKGSDFSLEDAIEIENAIARKYIEWEREYKNKTHISDFINNNEMTTRLKNTLISLLDKGDTSTGRDIDFIEDINKRAVELARNSGKKTVDELEQLMAKNGFKLR